MKEKEGWKGLGEISIPLRTSHLPVTIAALQ
jgi:hypothetical protein